MAAPQVPSGNVHRKLPLGVKGACFQERSRLTGRGEAQCLQVLKLLVGEGVVHLGQVNLLRRDPYARHLICHGAAQLRLARPPAVVRHGIAGGQADGGVVVLHRQAVLLQLGVGAGSVEVDARVAGVQGDDPAVVLRRPAVLPQLAVRQPSDAQGFGIVRVRLDPLRQALDHPANALPPRAVHHPAELVVLLRWLPPDPSRHVPRP